MNWFLHVLKNYFDESLMITVVVFVFLINFRAHSENEGTSLPSADSCTSPTKIDSSYNKTAKQCLEEISGKCAADWCKSQTWSFFVISLTVYFIRLCLLCDFFQNGTPYISCLRVFQIFACSGEGDHMLLWKGWEEWWFFQNLEVEFALSHLPQGNFCG